MSMDQSRSGDDASHDRLAAAIRDCGARLDRIEAANRTTRLLLAGATCGLLAMAATFGWNLWKTLERQLTAERVEASLQRKLEAIGPPLGQKLTDEVLGAVPAYGDLAIERGQKIWPDLSEKIAAEAQTFAADTEKMVRDRTDAAVGRVAARLSEDIRRDFPSLTEQRAEAIAKKLHQGLIEEGAGFGEEIEATIGRERARLSALLEKLPIDEAVKEPESRLQKRFMRAVLGSIDAAVEAWPTDDEASTPAPSGAAEGVAAPTAVPKSRRAIPATDGEVGDPPPSASPAEQPPADAPPAAPEVSPETPAGAG